MPNARKEISRHVERRLWALSGHFCTFPQCTTALTSDADKSSGITTVGDICHINALSPNGPRPFPPDSSEDPHAYENLILLCPTHHRIVDRHEREYPAEMLTKWKSDRENEIIRMWEVIKFNSNELDAIITWLADSSELPRGDFSLTPVKDKIRRNDLSTSTQRLIGIGLFQAAEVESYINNVSKPTSGFAYLVLGPLLTLYGNLKRDGLVNDDVFSELVHFACGNSRNSARWVAAIVLIVYFFERCDLFDQ